MPCSNASPSRGNAARLVTVILGVVVAQHGLDLLERLPADVGGVFVPHDDPPLLAGKPHCPGCRRGIADRPRATVDEGPGVGGVLEHAQDRCDRRRAPDRGAEAAAARQRQAALVEAAQHLGCGTDPQEGREDQFEAGLHLTVGILDHHAARLADQAHRQHEAEFAALGLVQQASGQASTDGVQLHLGDRALEAKKKPPVRGARIVHAVAVADEALPVAAQIQPADTNPCSCG